MNVTSSKNQNSLVSAQWLAAHIHDPDLYLIDCTTHMVTQAVGPSKIRSGRPDYDIAHLPGAVHIDMVQDLSDPNGRYPYTAISETTFAKLMQRLGIKPSDHVVLYGQSGISTITRAWFIFYLHGHARLSILDGGMAQYKAVEQLTALTVNQRPIEEVVAPTVPQNRNLIVYRDAVRQALEQSDRQLINALSQEQFNATGGAHYGRAGRIPQSLNLPAKSTIDPATGCFWDLETIGQKVAAAGISLTKPSLHYCGGGIAATTSAFVMHLLGVDNWVIYDDSLLDWANQPDCPMVVGD